MSTYTPIATINITGTTSSVTFSNIPQTYTDLILVTTGPSTAVQDLNCTFNGDTGSNYGFVYFYGDGSSAVSGNTANATRIVVGRTGSDNTGVAQFYNYSNSNIRKTILSRTNRPSEITMGFCNVWRNTAAITSMTITPASGTLSAGYTLNLYGIANASITNVAKATGGDSVYTDGTYWYHTFLSSGVFRPTQSLTVDYLVVAGGGAGLGRGSRGGGGGGAGGLRCTVGATGGGGSLESPLSLTAQAYTVTIGAGGNVSNGSNSVFSTITSIGGGQGSYADNASSGGSGGGGDGTTTNGAAGTANQGYAGGNGGVGGFGGGGGGGAGAAGTNNFGTTGGTGGNGVTTSISGASVTYAGGGGGGAVAAGGAAGTGGGGAGSSSTNGNNGTANTGGGGGGSGSGTDFLNSLGGSGIVIVRYAV